MIAVNTVQSNYHYKSQKVGVKEEKHVMACKTRAETNKRRHKHQYIKSNHPTEGYYDRLKICAYRQDYCYYVNYDYHS
jgi:hypothetical protein